MNSVEPLIYSPPPVIALLPLNIIVPLMLKVVFIKANGVPMLHNQVTQPSIKKFNLINK